MKLRKVAHAICKSEYPVVWIPTYRPMVVIKGVKEYMEDLLYHILELDPDIEVVKLNFQVDHVHVVVVIPQNRLLPAWCSISSHSQQRRLRRNVLFCKESILPEKASGPAATE
jgi:REP element-mobilizing transposase RayT